jgi:hypothetical protein
MLKGLSPNYCEISGLHTPYWIAPESIPPGERYGIAIDRAI